MTISGIGNTGIDYTRLSARQVEQQEAQLESGEQTAEAAQTVQQAVQSDESQRNDTSDSYHAAQAQSSAATAVQVQTDSADAAASGNTLLTDKARSGAELSQSELSQLKELDSALYAQAVKAQKARAQVRERMKVEPSSSGRIARQAIAQADHEQDGGSAVRAVLEEQRSFAAKFDQADFSRLAQQVFR